MKALTHGLCFFLALLLAGQACRPAEEEPPKNLIPPPKMARILTEIHLAEARVGRMGLGSTDSSALVYKRLEKDIFVKHQIDTAAYNQSYRYYSANPAQLAEIYQQVTRALEPKKKSSKMQ